MLRHPNPPKPYPGAPSPVLPGSTAATGAPIAYDHALPPVRGPPEAPATLAEDLLQGAEAIALYMFGTVSAMRVVYRLSSEVKPEDRPPFFKLGRGTLCARKSALLRWIAERETAHENA
jgi:hypothetical protein